ncbi:MAG: SDR family NAD(P)-dependent oxidoreductase, partial [Tsuneonella sp.]
MKTAFVSGATAGIGAATVRILVASGWRCVATGRRTERLDALVEELAADKVHPAVFDVRDTAAMDLALANLPEGFRDIDLLVNNAGLAQGLSPAQTANLDDWQTMIDTNVTAMVTLTRKLLPGLIERKGAIVTIGSVAGNYVYPGGNVYAGSKAFANHFTLALRADLHG